MLFTSHALVEGFSKPRQKEVLISRSKHTSDGQNNKASEQVFFFSSSCVMLQWLNSTECFLSGCGIV